MLCNKLLNIVRIVVTNLKKPIRLLTNTKYFEPSRSRLYNTFSSPSSYRSRQQKIEGYETRLYWQYRYCEDVGGQTFYYTLTYNDKSIPKFYGVNCFDYEDLRYLLTGGFYQYLRRHYGTKLKYFVGAELGDGKGQRGMHNNPHYHILFFLEPDKEPLCPYQKISPEDFRHLVRLYWQGFDEDVDGFQDYRTAKYGIAKEGEDCGLVHDHRACMYCAKYVTKDVHLVRSEYKVAHFVRFYTEKKYKHSLESFKDFYQANKSLFDIHLTVRFFHGSNSFYSCKSVLDKFLSSFCCEMVDVGEYQGDYYELIKSLGLYEDYCKYVRDYVSNRVKEVITEYRNRYCNKCRISQAVGVYALKNVDPLNPSVQVPSKNGFKARPLPLYLYRKLYTNVIKVDECIKTPRGILKARKHCPVRVMNDLGIDLKVKRLPLQVKKIAEQAQNNLSSILGDSSLYEKMLASDVNVNVTFTFDSFKHELEKLQSELPLYKILERYAIFKLVYEDRFFQLQNVGSTLEPSFPPIDVESDYRRFLTPTTHYVSRSDLRVSSFVESDMAGYIPYFSHPYFLSYFGIFRVLDLCADYFFVQTDNVLQTEAEEIAAIKRFHSIRALIDFYSQFKSNVL